MEYIISKPYISKSWNDPTIFHVRKGRNKGFSLVSVSLYKIDHLIGLPPNRLVSVSFFFFIFYSNCTFKFKCSKADLCCIYKKDIRLVSNDFK